MKKSIQFLAMLAVVTSCGHKQDTAKSIQESAIKITTEQVQTVKSNVELRYSGTVEPLQTIPLSFQTNGIVDNVFVQAGDVVHKGQILAVVNKADNQSVYDASSSKYLQAKDAYDRLKSVHEKGSLTDLKWVEMETNLKQAESQVQLSKSNLEKCNMRAPDNGMIGSRNVEPGQSSISSTTPLELVKIEHVLVKIAVPENEISKIKKGIKAKFSISALNGKTFEGEVTNVGVVADKISRTYEVKIMVNNSNLEIKPGMVCDVNLNISAEREFVIVPYNAILKDEDGKPFVFIVSDDKKSVKKQIVTVGNYQNKGIEILSGLKSAQTVVVEGKEKLTDNSLISL